MFKELMREASGSTAHLIFDIVETFDIVYSIWQGYSSMGNRYIQSVSGGAPGIASHSRLEGQGLSTDQHRQEDRYGVKGTIAVLGL